MAKPIRKKKYSNPITNNRLFRVLVKQAIAIRSIKQKNQHLVEEWLRKFADFIYAEDNKHFEPAKLGKYKAGDIIFAEFGYNVGSEFGGSHYAVVIENSPLNAKMIMVVPLSSLEPSQSEEDVHPNDAYLGELPQLNKIAHSAEGTKSFAVINQTRAIAKQRIIAPVNKYHKRIFIDGPLLGLIYDKFKTRYTTQGLKRINKPEEE
ncbi:type II toxin-antitoxin system PemK/MazF family toxin [Bacillus salipaludis]|uniref:Type II toxin-antitoxin system PemK/MazF family toxin n=1 Tax=Bacillus salipaludis TaxID=2547811 RepID=A0A4R5VHY0_9BACI|nr:type II toxin-antitoxin system PemK/MazF family toxin [Bacillus salipaludis]TDK54755.1 type II toxin-antitoxin system PemK/MazF family toxin [Bacillus salipaludis]